MLPINSVFLLWRWLRFLWDFLSYGRLLLDFGLNARRNALIVPFLLLEQVGQGVIQIDSVLNLIVIEVHLQLLDWLSNDHVFGVFSLQSQVLLELLLACCSGLGPVWRFLFSRFALR